MKEQDRATDLLPDEDPREEVRALYALIRTDTDRREATIALADGIHQNNTARDYSSLLSRPTGELTHIEIVRRDWYNYGNTLTKKDEVELVVKLIVEEKNDRPE